MSIRVMTWVWENARDVAGNDLVVLLALADHADDEGTAWPSIPRLARKARISVRSVINITERLQAQGYITVEKHVGRGHTNRYTVQMLHVLAPETVQDLHGIDEEIVQLPTQIVQNGARNSATAIAPESSIRIYPETSGRNGGYPRGRASPRPAAPFPDDFKWLTKEFWQWVDNEQMQHEWVKRRLRKYQLTFKANGAMRQDWIAQVQAWLLEDRDSPSLRR